MVERQSLAEESSFLASGDQESETQPEIESKGQDMVSKAMAHEPLPCIWSFSELFTAIKFWIYWWTTTQMNPEPLGYNTFPNARAAEQMSLVGDILYLTISPSLHHTKINYNEIIDLN